MDFRQLQYFVKVVQEKSFSRAAEQLYVSQPALSKTISGLEEELGTRLILRNSRKFVLTAHGKTLYEKSRGIISDYENLQEYAAKLVHDNGGTIRCGISLVLNTILVPYLLKFQRQYTDIELDIHELPTKDLLFALQRNNLDVAFSIAPFDYSELDIHPIAKDYASVIMPNEHPLAGKDVVSAEDLRGQKLILLNDRYVIYDNVVRACEKAGFKPQIQKTSMNWDFLLSVVKMGAGLTVLPHPILKNLDEQLVQKPLTGEIARWEVVAMTKKGAEPLTITQTLIGFFRDALQHGFQ